MFDDREWDASTNKRAFLPLDGLDRLIVAVDERGPATLDDVQVRLGHVGGGTELPPASARRCAH
jgi:hypothetical protein